MRVFTKQYYCHALFPRLTLVAVSNNRKVNIKMNPALLPRGEQLNPPLLLVYYKKSWVWRNRTSPVNTMRVAGQVCALFTKTMSKWIVTTGDTREEIISIYLTADRNCFPCNNTFNLSATLADSPVSSENRTFASEVQINSLFQQFRHRILDIYCSLHLHNVLDSNNKMAKRSFRYALFL